MSTLFIGTDSGVFLLGDGGKEVVHEEGPQPIAFLSRGPKSLFAITGRGEAPLQAAQSDEGALWERTGAGSWRLVNDSPVPDKIWSFAADPWVAGLLYIGVGPALLYRSVDGGQSWTPCDAIRRIPGYKTWSFPPPPHIPHVRCIAPDPKVAGAVYIGVEEGGVYHSADGGESWESLNDGLNSDVHTVTPAPEEGRLYATTGVGFHRSDDGGSHWRHVEQGLGRQYTIPFAISHERLGRLFTAAASTPPPGWTAGVDAAIYRSDDGGEQWVRLGRGLSERFDAMVRYLALGDGGVLYAAAGSKLFVSRDEGENWSSVAAELPTVRALAVV